MPRQLGTSLTRLTLHMLGRSGRLGRLAAQLTLVWGRPRLSFLRDRTDGWRTFSWILELETAELVDESLLVRLGHTTPLALLLGLLLSLLLASADIGLAFPCFPCFALSFLCFALASSCCLCTSLCTSPCAFLDQAAPSKFRCLERSYIRIFDTWRREPVAIS